MLWYFGLFMTAMTTREIVICLHFTLLYFASLAFGFGLVLSYAGYEHFKKSLNQLKLKRVLHYIHEKLVLVPLYIAIPSFVNYNFKSCFTIPAVSRPAMQCRI